MRITTQERDSLKTKISSAFYDRHLRLYKKDRKEYDFRLNKIEEYVFNSEDLIERMDKENDKTKLIKIIEELEEKIKEDMKRLATNAETGELYNA